MQELTFHRHFVPSCERFGDDPFVTDGPYAATYGEHFDRTLRTANTLIGALELPADAPFAVISANSHAYLELYHAAFLGAGVINPLNHRLSPAELTHVLSHSGSSVVFTDSTFAEVVARIRPDLPNLRNVVLLDSGDGIHDARYEDLLGDARSSLPPEPDETAPAVLMYTGGTTGLPKGVLCSQRAEMLNWYHVVMRHPQGADTVVLQHTPMFHATAMVPMLSLPHIGGRLVIVPGFDPVTVMEAIETHRVTDILVIPTMLAMLLNHPEFQPDRLSSLRILAYGGAPMPTALLDRALGLWPEIEFVQGYGMTEASSALTYLGGEDHRGSAEHLRSVGRALPGVTLTIQDGQGSSLPQGEVGEVCVRSGNLMDCYWQDPEATAAAFRNGWYRTGDAGFLGEEGHLYLVDRVKDMIITGGENVYSVEVENAVATHPAVAMVAVIGIPDELWGEQVHAVVTLKEGAMTTAKEIQDHVRTSLACYKVPKSVDFRDELPLSGAMKPLKRELRKEYLVRAGDASSPART